jgi:hypothetical protein
MTSTRESQPTKATILKRAEAVAQDFAEGPVGKISISKWAASDRGPGMLLRDPARFAVYYNLLDEPKNAPARMVPVCLMLDADELRALDQEG